MAPASVNSRGLADTPQEVVDMPERTPMRSGGHEYTAEMLALAIVEAEIRGDMTDRADLIRAALAEDPQRVIEVLANLLHVELVDGYGDHATCQTKAIRWAILNPGVVNG